MYLHFYGLRFSLVPAKFLVFISSALKKRFSGEHHPFTIPFIGTFGSMPKGILMTPFWIGPLQSLLSIFGVFKLDGRGQCIALSLVFSALIPGALIGIVGNRFNPGNVLSVSSHPHNCSLGFLFYYSSSQSFFAIKR